MSTPDLTEWAWRVQIAFSHLPGALKARTAPDTSSQAPPPRWAHERFCRDMVEALESMRQTLVPAPTLQLGIAFVAYIDRLLVLYRECPDSRESATELHDQANKLGYRFEQMLNAALKTKS